MAAPKRKAKPKAKAKAKAGASPAQKKPVGRPSLMQEPEYREEICDRVIELGRLGKSECQISGEIDVPRGTMHRWSETYPEFRAALTRAKQLEQMWWENAGQGGLIDKNFNANLWNKSMSARFRDDYGERVKQEITGKDGKDLIPDTPKDDLDLARYMALILSRAAKQTETQP